MDKYILTRFDCGHEIQFVTGNSIEFIRDVIDSSSPDFLREGYAVYETRCVERGPWPIKKEKSMSDYDWQDSWALTEDKEYYEGLMGIRK